MIKKSLVFSVLAGIFFAISTFHNTIYANNSPFGDAESSGRFVDSFEEFDFFDDDFLSIEGNRTQPPIDCNQILTFLLDLNIVNVLENEFFIKTNQLNKRSLLDSAILGSIQGGRVHDRMFNVDLFYNQITRNNFTLDSTSLDSYLALTSPTLLTAIQNSIPFNNFNIKTIFSLFQDMTSQQRSTGLMFFYLHRYKDNLIRFFTPFYYIERNLFLTPEERADIDEELGAGDPEQAQELQKKYFIADRLGLGDTRIEVETPAIRHDLLSLNVGGFLTIPTAFTVQGGILGSTYAKPCAFPEPDIDRLVEIANEAFRGTEQQMQQAQEEAVDIARALLLGALDRFSSNVLDTKLGNNGHVGIGLFYRSQAPLTCLIKREWARQIHFFNKTTVEYLFPASEKRFYIKKLNPLEFSSRDFTDPTKACANLTFLGQELIDKFYLVALDTVVQPGIILHSNGKICYQGNTWGCNVGADFWLQTRGLLGSITNPTTSMRHLTVETIDLKKALPFFAYQFKIFGGVTCQIERPHTTWFTSLNLDSTLCSSGIGRDYTIAIKFEKHF